MSKSKPQSQGVFSFFDEIEKTVPVPKPRLNTLRPPPQVEAVQEETEPLDMHDTQAEQSFTEIGADEATEAPHTMQSGEALQENDLDEVNEDQGIESEHGPMTVAFMDTVPGPITGMSIVDEETMDNAPKESMQVPETIVQDSDVSNEDIDINEKIFSPAAKRTSGGRGRRSVKDNSLAAEMIDLPDDEELFKKQYYSMGEVTTMFNESHSLIRYWESEFDILKPKKNGKGDRFFRPADVKNLYLIYDLLRRRKFTIEGAKDFLKNDKSAEEKFAAVQSLQKIKSFFLELKANL